MSEDHGDVRERLGEVCTILHLRCEDLQLEDEIVLRQQPDVAAQSRIVHDRRPVGEAVLLVLVPMQLHADTAQ